MNLDQSAPVVLIVEAKGLIRSTISKEFQRAGWSVLEASTGEGSLVLAARGPQVDAVVTDIELGGDVNGWDVAEAFRTKNPETAVIYASDTSAANDRMVRGSAFFIKPFESGKLLQTCDRLKRER
jgi:DNA-binding response OmpR family regulator